MTDTLKREITYLRLSVTERCNLRCRYCMPEEGICKKLQSEMLTEEETVLAVEAAASLGVKKLRITGGEPLVKKNIVSLCRNAGRVHGIEELCLTTNGILLPQLAGELVEAGVSRVNISMDTLNSEKYAYMTRSGSLEQALAGLNAAFEAGFKLVKINTVLIRGFNDGEIPALAELTMKYPVDVRFIELMPMYNDRDFGPEAYMPCGAVLESLPELSAEEDDPGAVARMFRLPGALGRVGLISPLSGHFCAACNRIRLTADGKLKPCLHSSQELSIKGLDYPQMVEQFKAAIMAKPEWHGELSFASPTRANRRMNQIGG